MKRNIFTRLSKSFAHATRGIVHSLKYEQNFKIHFLAALAVIGLGLYFSITVTEWLFLIVVITLVLALEMLNSIVEDILDATSPHFSKSARAVKDVMAGAVLVTAIGAVVVGVIVFYPYIVKIMGF